MALAQLGISGSLTDLTGIPMVGVPIAILVSGTAIPMPLWFDSAMTKRAPNPIYTSSIGGGGAVAGGYGPVYPGFTFLGNTTNGSAVVTGLPNLSTTPFASGVVGGPGSPAPGLGPFGTGIVGAFNMAAYASVGAYVTGSGIPSQTSVIASSPAAGTITLSANATATASNVLITVMAQSWDAMMFPQILEGMELGPMLAGPTLVDTVGTIPGFSGTVVASQGVTPVEQSAIWSAGGAVTTSLASLFAMGASINVLAGQKYFAMGMVNATMGSTAGNGVFTLQKAASDSAVIAWGFSGANAPSALTFQKAYAISEVMQVPLFGAFTVTTGGLLTLSMFGQSSGAAGTVAANGASMYIRRLA